MDFKKIIENIKNIPSWLTWIFVSVIFSDIAYYANFRSDTIYDPDSFYHIRHAWLYRQNGIFFSDFPWVQFSVIKDLKADLWYGFHLLLIPFTYFNDLTLGIKVAGFFITFAVLWSFYFALKNLKVYFPAFWSALFIFSSPMVLFRMSVTRPHPLSLALFVLLFSFLISGPAWIIFVLSFLVAWIHSSLFWFPFLIISVVWLFSIINYKRFDFYKPCALTAGVLAGLFSRPHPVANLKLIYIQIIELYASKKEVLDQIIGGELQSPDSHEILINTPLLILLALAGIIILILLFRKKIAVPAKTRIAMLSSLTLVCVSVLMYINANRAIEMLAAFTIIFSASAVSFYRSEIKDKMSNKVINTIVPAISLLIILGIINTVKISGDYLAVGKLRTAFKEPAQWLEKNTKEGDIVFHLVWSQFPLLFYWNQHNYYIDGMDPIFLYSYNKKLYWEAFYMFRKDMSGLTCGFQTCGPEQIEPVYDVLVNDFHASYVFVRKLNNPRFREYLESDKKHFEKVYDENSSLIYKILPPKPSKTGIIMPK